MDRSSCALFKQLAPELQRFLYLQAREANHTLEAHLDLLSELDEEKLDGHIRAVDEIISLVLGQQTLVERDWSALCLRERLMRVQEQCDAMLERARHCEFVRAEVGGLLPRLVAIVFASNRLAGS